MSQYIVPGLRKKQTFFYSVEGITNSSPGRVLKTMVEVSWDLAAFLAGMEPSPDYVALPAFVASIVELLVASGIIDEFLPTMVSSVFAKEVSSRICQ